jgi:O-antigen/teichoic acid export membrane protein
MSTGSLGGLAERAFNWSALTTLARFALQLCAQVVLARVLGPSNFGVYGIGMVVMGFVGFLSGSSFSWNLMLQPTITDEDIRFSFTWQAVVGLIAAAGMYFCAPLLAVFFGDPEVESMVRWLALATLFTALLAPASFLLQRDMNFRALGIIGLVSYAIGYLAVGVTMALNGFGALSLAAACIVQSGVSLVLIFAARPHSLRPLFLHSGAGITLRTGRTVFYTSVVNWLLANVDRVIIGRVLNTQAVGIYTVATNLASIPNVLLIGTLQPAFMATGAKLQEDRPRLGQAWLLGVACILVLLTPLAVVGALLSDDLIALLYGPAWSEAAWVLAALLLCMPVWACWGMSTPVLWNTGRKHQEAMLQAPLLLAAVPAWWFFAAGGIRAVAVVSVTFLLLRAAVIIGAALRALDLRWTVLLPPLLRGLGLAALAGAAVWMGQQAVAGLRFPGAGLFAGGAAASAALLLVIGLRPRVLGEHANNALVRLVPALAQRHGAVAPTLAGGGHP